MELTKCITLCKKSALEGVSNDVTVRLISSLTLFLFNAELVFFLP